MYAIRSYYDRAEGHAVVIADDELDVLREAGGKPGGHLVVSVLGGPVRVGLEGKLLDLHAGVGENLHGILGARLGA